jgi:hypothetical protein
MKTRVIRIRVSEKFYNFLVDATNEVGTTLSEFIRNAVTFYLIGSVLGKFKFTVNELKDELLNKRYSKNKK